MGIRTVFLGICVLLVSAGSAARVGAQYAGWHIPDGALEAKSPASGPDVALRGKAIFATNCARCHGPDGKGGGPDSDHAADLTDDLRTELNPEGVLFYKVLNGHGIQLRGFIYDMPAFSAKLSKEEIWAVVEYLKVLRTSRP